MKKSLEMTLRDRAESNNVTADKYLDDKAMKLEDITG